MLVFMAISRRHLRAFQVKIAQRKQLARAMNWCDLLSFTESVQTQLTSVFVRKLKNELDQGNVACLDDKVMAPDIEYQIGKYITKLTEHGIYDRAINS